MKRYLIIGCICFICVCRAEAAEAPNDAIKQAIVNKLSQMNSDSQHMQLELGSIDSKLNLSKCHSPLDVHVPKSQHGPKILVTVSCQDSEQWRINVPVMISHQRKVLVVQQNLLPGSRLSTANVALEERNISAVNQSYIDDINQVSGMVLKRAVKAGTLINQTMLQYPTCVKRGDTVQAIAEKGNFKVQTTVIAQKNGRLNEEIPVKNISSQKVISARVIADGKVEINLQ